MLPDLARYRLSVVLLAVLLTACQQPAEVRETKDSFLAFGTFVEVTLIDVPKDQQRAALDAIEQDLEFMHYAFHPWKSGPTSRINQLLAAAGEFTANPSMIPIITRTQELAIKSQHLFNPAIGHMMHLWGYHEELPPEGPPPAKEDIQKLLAQKPGMESISIRGIRVDNSNPNIRLDLGGVAKGFALDQIMSRLQNMGVQHAILNTGGDLKVLGKHGNRPWHIGIRHPRNKGIIAGLDVHDGEAVVTSGDYERYYEYEGKRYHHILDPRTGYPAEGTQSVTVVSRDGALADAAATALFVAGPSQWVEIAKTMGVDTVMLIDSEARIHLSEKMQQRIQFENPVSNVSVVKLP